MLSRDSSRQAWVRGQRSWVHFSLFQSLKENRNNTILSFDVNMFRLKSRLTVAVSNESGIYQNKYYCIIFIIIVVSITAITVTHYVCTLLFYLDAQLL